MLRRSTLAGSILAATALTGGAIATGPSASAAEAQQSTQNVSSSVKIKCGFHITTQSYKNCTSNDRTVIATAHESATGKIFTLNYCLGPGEQQAPLGMPGMMVYAASSVEAKHGC